MFRAQRWRVKMDFAARLYQLAYPVRGRFRVVLRLSVSDDEDDRFSALPISRCKNLLSSEIERQTDLRRARQVWQCKQSFCSGKYENYVTG